MAGKGLAGIVLGALAIYSAILPAQSSAGALTPLDFYQIHELNARYSHGLDSGDGGLFAGVFTEDGILIDENGVTTTGRDRLSMLAAATPGKGPTNLSHFYTNLVVDRAPGGAIAKSYATISRAAGSAPAARLTGQYWDDLVRTPLGWRIKKRTFLKTGTPRPRTDPLATTVEPFAAAVAQKGGLTADDYAQIHQLYSRYALWWDKPVDGGRSWAALFTADGTFIDAAGRVTTGRGNLQELVWTKGPWDIGTRVSNIMVEPRSAGTAANTKAYYIRHVVTTGRGAPPSAPQTSEKLFGFTRPQPGPDHPAAIFFARVVKTADGWRFKSLSVVESNAPVSGVVAATLK